MILSKKEYYDYLNEDLKAFGLNRFGYKEYFTHDSLRFLRRLRKIEYYTNVYPSNPFLNLYRLYLRYINHRLATRLGFTVPINVFGPGLHIVHYGTIVVSAEARVGKSCRIHPGTCIGENNGAPIIGDNVYIGPGAKLFGNITIGNEIAIGANSVVNKSFLQKGTIAGAPAKVISSKSSIEQDLFN